MKRIFSVLSGALFLSAAVPVSAAVDRTPSLSNPPLVRWQAPASFTPPRGTGRTALTDITGPLPLIPIVPCRQYDSRSATPLADNTARIVTVTGAPCGVLFPSYAVAVNITVFNITGAGGNGVFKIGSSAPPTAAWINYPPTETQRANAGVVSTNGNSIAVQVNQGGGSVDFVVDIFGYYPQSDSGHLLNANEYFEIATSIAPPFASINARNNSTAAGAMALQGIAGGGTGDTIAIFGTNGSTGAGSVGVSGLATNGIGVLGTSTNNVGAQGLSTAFNGVWAQSTNQDGLFASGGRDGAFITGARFGVQAVSTGTGGVFAVQGSVFATTTIGSGGVRGLSPAIAGTYGVIGQAASANWNSPNSFLAGGRFLGSNGGFNGHGVVAEGVTSGLTAYRVNAAGTVQTWGAVGFLGSDGLYSNNNLTAVGTKSFVEPHPTDPTLVIKYVALEGPEAGTYFRGRGQIVGGHATIQVPDNFRMVTDTEGLTVQITPIGRPSAVGVVSMGLDTIEVEATRDVEFSYLVQGVRRVFRDFKPIQPDSESFYFRPQTPNARLDLTLPEEMRQRLIASGVYNPDGTANVGTAERMGWAQKWRDDEARSKAAQEALLVREKAAQAAATAKPE